MKALFQELPFEDDRYFNVYKEDLPHFIVPWHYHPSIEIMFIVSGTGTRLVGDHIETYEEGDVCIIGPSLPHEWRNDKIYFQKGSTLRSTCYCLFFRKELLDGNLIRLPEMGKIRSLLEKSRYGIKFTGETRNQLGSIITGIYNSKGMRRITQLFGLLEMMSETDEYELLSSEAFAESISSDEFIRLNKVCQYIIDNYNRPIRLQDAAAIANMAQNAFCRYFKSRTKKTFVQYLNDIRIGQAKKLLIENKHKITTISMMVGFNNLTNFYEQFKKNIGITPAEYQKKYIDLP